VNQDEIAESDLTRALDLIQQPVHWPGIRIMSDVAKDIAPECLDLNLSPVDVEECGVAVSMSTLMPGRSRYEDKVAVNRRLGITADLSQFKNDRSVFAVDALQRVTRANEWLTRGLPRPFCRDLFLYRLVPEGYSREIRVVVGWDRGKQRWIAADKRQADFFHSNAGDAVFGGFSGVRVLLAMAFAERYAWKARLLSGKGHLVIHTDQKGAGRFFAARDAYPGERRAALLHYVRSHKRRVSDDLTVDVRQHLRGSRSFTWNGWQARIDESDHERERSIA
jgi:hypothetical protein